MPSNDELRYLWQRNLQRRYSVKTIDAALAALSRFEEFSKGRPFHRLHPSLVDTFKAHLAESESDETGEPYSRSTVVHTLMHCQAFFEWLASRRGYRRIEAEAINAFQPSRDYLARFDRLVTRPIATLEELSEVLAQMPDGSLEERRDRAIFACLMVYGLRIDAAASLRLGSVDPNDMSIYQDAKHVRVKNSRSQKTLPFPFDGLALSVFGAWVRELRDNGLPGHSALFPKTPTVRSLDAGSRVAGLDLTCWKQPAHLRDVVRRACEEAGRPYYHPHSFRKTLARAILEARPDIDTFWAAAQNLGHKDMMTTLQHYGVPSDDRRRQLIAGLSSRDRLEGVGETGAAFIRDLQATRPKAAAAIIALLAAPD